MNFRNIGHIFLFFPILAFQNGCKNVDNSKFTNYFFYNEDANITTLDPAFVKSQSENWAVSHIFEGLVEYDDSLRIRPCLAKRWSVSDDGRVYTFVLRSDVLFHHSSKHFKANDVVFSFKRIADPKTASPGAWIFNDKMDLRCFTDPAVSFPVKALNDSTVEITLTRPFSPFLGILAMPYCYIVNPDAAANATAFRTQPVGTGPFRLKKWEEDVAILFDRNSDYYRYDHKGVRLPYLSGIYLDNIKNKQTAFMRFMQGEYDFFNGIDANIADELLNNEGQLKTKHKAGLKLLKSPFLNTEYIGFNIDPSFGNHPLGNFKIRQAIQYAVDKEKLITYLRNGVGIPARHGFVPTGLPDFPYERVKGYEYNLNKARQLVKESGIDFNNAPAITINTINDYLSYAVFVQKELEMAGIPVKIEIHPSSFVRQLRKEQKINCFRGSWIADYPDAENYMICFKTENFSPAGPNYFHYSDKRVDQLIDESNVNISDSVRNLLLAQADNIATAAGSCLVLFYDESIRLCHHNVQGLTSNPINFLRLREVRKTP